MKLRDAHKLLKGADLSSQRNIALICSFEPLHLKTLLQARVVERCPRDAPRVVPFGYDSLTHALDETSTAYALTPTLLVVTWEDLHPSLSWRTRAQFGTVSVEEMVDAGSRLFEQLRQWLAARAGAETYVAFPPLEWMPWLDPEPTAAVGPLRAGAARLLAQGVAELQALGARILHIPSLELSLRDLFLAGSPISADGADRIAQVFVDASLPLIERKKVLVLDVDGTLWKGVLGEDGVEGIECGDDEQGWPYYTFQKFLLKLKRDGIILALCSKNDPADVQSAFLAKDMPLSWDDFSAQRVSWDSKTDSLRSLSEELNIGFDAFIFVDDNEAEIALVEYELPAVSTIVVPKNMGEWTSFFRELQDLCATWQVTPEDRVRADMVREGRPSLNADRTSPSAPSWAHLGDFELHVSFNDDAFGDPRSLQLVNKTNQFNLTGERISSEVWLSLRATNSSFCCSTRLADRFGDFGTIAVAVGERRSDDELCLRQFVVSCRAFGRGVEYLTLLHLLQLYRAEVVAGPYRDTGRNEPVRRFLEELESTTEAGAFTISRDALERTAHRLLEQARPVVAQ